MSLPCEFSDPVRCLGNALDGREIKAIELCWQQKELSRDIVAESLDRRVRGRTADTGLTEKEVHQLVQQRE